MRLAPNSRKWLEKGQCLYCGQSWISHKNGQQYIDHWNWYANSYNTKLSENQKSKVLKYANKKDKLTK